MKSDLRCSQEARLKSTAAWHCFVLKTKDYQIFDPGVNLPKGLLWNDFAEDSVKKRSETTCKKRGRSGERPPPKYPRALPLGVHLGALRLIGASKR